MTRPPFREPRLPIDWSHIHPTIDSPLGDLIMGRIDQPEYERRLAVRRDHRTAAPDPDPLHVPEDERVPSPWQHQRQRAMERERIVGRRLGCAVVLLAALFGLLVIVAIVVAVL